MDKKTSETVEAALREAAQDGAREIQIFLNSSGSNADRRQRVRIAVRMVRLYTRYRSIEDKHLSLDRAITAQQAGVATKRVRAPRDPIVLEMKALARAAQSKLRELAG
jgi:hypothetical protein